LDQQNVGRRVECVQGLATYDEITNLNRHLS
jgi:hypothetical protein